MAATAAGAALTRQHRQAQAAIRTLTLRRLTDLWQLLDPQRLDATSPGYLDAAVSLVRGSHALSARAAASYYLAYRLAEGVAGAAPAVTAAPLSVAAVRTSLIVTGPVALKKATGRGVPLPKATVDAFTMTSGAVGRHTASGGWDTVQSAVQRDDKALGWARVASANGCAFCLMLASRGPVYKSDSTAGFEAHDHCFCEIEAAFDNYQWDPVSVRAREAWDAARDSDGFLGEFNESIGKSVAPAENAKQRNSQLINGPFRQYLARNPL